MGTQPARGPGRRGTPGLDLFKIAGESISGFLPSFKTGDPHHVRQPFTSHLEERLALYLEYHPHVRVYQRGDASEAFAHARRLHTPLGTPYRIAYLYEGQAHEYLPDFVGTLCDGGLLIAEAGRASKKSQDQAVAKAVAAQRLAQLNGGVYWIGTEETLVLRRHYNLLYLHARRQVFPTYGEIAATLVAEWPWGENRSVQELARRFGQRWSDHEVEAAVWKLVGDAAAEGRLLVDLTEVELSLSTDLALLDPGLPPILPDPLPSRLGGEDGTSLVPGDRADERPRIVPERIPDHTFDASTIPDAAVRARFHRNLAAVEAVLAGHPRRQVAQAAGMHPSNLARLVERVRHFGQIACVPHATYHRDRALRPEFQEVLRHLYTDPIRPTLMAVYEDVRLQQLADHLSAQEKTPVLPPTYKQVWSFLTAIAQEREVRHARSGLPHPPPECLSSSSFVLSIPYPASICQIDEHTLDLLVVTASGTVLTRRAHAAVLICVKTAAILGAVLALDTLREEDYMRLVKQALEPKDRLTLLYECHHPWPCSGKPTVIFHDRGNIFTSERATQVLVDRLGITTEQAPPYAPSAKGTVEALFTWTTRKLEHRLPGTTKATAHARGAYDSVGAAEKAGITLDVLEKFFIQAIVDGYMQEWDKLRRARRLALWDESVRDKGVPRWMGAPDDLKLLLMKAVNRKNPSTGRYAITHGSLSFLGRQYTSPGLLDRLRGREIDIYYDRRDIAVIYLFLEGVLVGEAYCTELLGRRLSIWEAQAANRTEAEQAAQAATVSRAARQRIQQEAQAARTTRSRDSRRLERQRQLDRQRSEIHPTHVLERLAALVPAPSARIALPKATPDPDLDGPLPRLPIREHGEDVP
jgi:hypothetical protein